MSYRKLSVLEIEALEKQGCEDANNWVDFNVSLDFSTDNIKNTTFSGTNYIGSFVTSIITKDNIKRKPGIYNSSINNCTIGNNTLISNVGNIISNYKIEDKVEIVNVDEIICSEESTFGNGIKVTPVNEAGGRDITIYNQLSSQVAFLLCFYRHNLEFIKTLEQSILGYCETIKSKSGTIKQHSKIYNCKSIINTNIGEYASINGVSLIENASINSSLESPAMFGSNVIARNFISLDGSIVKDGAQVNNCFIGEACEIAGGFSAENSLFFANSQALLGEACSIFAGPYTVTHHKSTLLIASNFSFFNAGSGTNQSNHMYKLGPVHQGIMERGCKTGSGSYVLWPGKIGPFTMILGKHYNNPDTSDFPFSYLIEDNGKSVLMPAQNMFNVGTYRDIEKWPQRDKRTSLNKKDILNYSALNPYTINKVIKGIEILNTLSSKAKPDTKSLMHKGTSISVASIKRGLKLYQQILITYISNSILESLDLINNEVPSAIELSEWLDVGGQIVQKVKLDNWVQKVNNSKPNVTSITEFFKTQDQNYSKDIFLHALNISIIHFKLDLSDKKDLKKLLQLYLETNKSTLTSIITDSKKEFNAKAKIGFGIYDDKLTIDNDFLNTRGELDSNSFIKTLITKYDTIEKNVHKIISSL